MSIIGVSTHTTNTHLPVKNESYTYNVVIKKEYSRKVIFFILNPDYQATLLISTWSGFVEKQTINKR